MKKGGGGARGGRLSVSSRVGGTFNSTKGEPQYWDVGGGGRWEGGKAEVYESKGTPNYSYTIHD